MLEGLVLDWLPPIYVAVIGALVGSFLNVVVLRLPRKISIVSPRSRCPQCGSAIRAIDNVPVLSWIVLGGRCRTCQAPISPRYAIVELLTAIVFVLVFRRFGIAPHTFVYLAFVAALIAITFVDIDHRIIPDSISLPGIPIGILCAALLPHAPGALLPPTAVSSVIGATVGAAVLWIATIVGPKLFGRDAMGFGDVKLLAMLGAFLGIHSILFVMLVASITGASMGIVTAVLSRSRIRGSTIPFGPYLAFGAVAYLLIGQEVVSLWLGRGAGL